MNIQKKGIIIKIRIMSNNSFLMAKYCEKLIGLIDTIQHQSVSNHGDAKIQSVFVNDSQSIIL